MGNTAARWLLWVSLIFLLWNLFGIAAFTMQWNMSPDDITKLPDAQQEMWATMGPGTWAAYAVAVLSGTAGAAALLMRKKWALACFTVSVVALLVQFSGPLGFALGAGELQMMVFPLCIIAVAILELLLTRNWRNQGLLN
jgi:hypothetical protein